MCRRRLSASPRSVFTSASAPPFFSSFAAMRSSFSAAPASPRAGSTSAAAAGAPARGCGCAAGCPARTHRASRSRHRRIRSARLLHPRREHIEDAAAHGELAGTFHPVAAGIARVRQLPGERRRVVPAAHLERQCGALKHLRRDTALRERLGRRHDDGRAACAAVPALPADGTPTGGSPPPRGAAATRGPAEPPAPPP